MRTGSVITTDVAVLGGGTAGPLVARKLLRVSSAEVLLIEAGPDYGSFEGGRWPPELLNADTLPVSHDWGYDGPGHDDSWHFDRAKVIGGCSAHNGCSQTVGVRADYEAMGIAWAEGEIARRVAELAVTMRVAQPSDDELTPFQAATLAAMVEVGIPRTDDLLDADGGPGCGPTPVNNPDGVRWNAAFSFLDDVRHDPRLTILGDSLIDRLVVEGGAVTGVLVRRGSEIVTIRADRYVLCAGAYGSPEILLRSGIGPADELAGSGITGAVDLPGVGRNLHDHPSVEVRFRASDRLVSETAEFARSFAAPDEQVIAKAASGVGTDPYDMHVFPFTETSPEGLDCVIPVASIAPRSRGSLRLRSADPRVRAHVDHRYLTDAAGRDQAVLEEGLRLAEAMAGSTALAGCLGAAVPDQAHPRMHTFAHYWHPVGTCAMGVDWASGAVVDGTGRVHGVDNLHVMDASVFPSVPRATTHTPVLLVVDRLVDDFIAGLSAGAFPKVN